MLSVTGTAAIINLLFTSGEIGVLNTALTATGKGGDPERSDTADGAAKKNNSPPKSQLASVKSAAMKHSKSIDNEAAAAAGAKNASSANAEVVDCTICHIPYSRTSVPFNEHMKKCLVCK